MCWVWTIVVKDIEFDVDDKEEQVSQFRSLPTHPTTCSPAKDDFDDEGYE